LCDIKKEKAVTEMSELDECFELVLQLVDEAGKVRINGSTN
jgi:hypothetical protein